MYREKEIGLGKDWEKYGFKVIKYLFLEDNNWFLDIRDKLMVKYIEIHF